MMAKDGRFRRILNEGRCIGCGLCSSMFPDKLNMTCTASGYLRPSLRGGLSRRESDAICSVCPGVVQAGLPEQLIGAGTIVDDVWGPHIRIETAYAADPDTRHRASTGGALTALCEYLIASGDVGAILHVAAGGASPSFGKPQVSDSREAVLAGAGSRYGPADPLAALGSMLEAGTPFAVVGKPCDLSAIRLLGRSDGRVRGLITHFLGLFCGGIMAPFGMETFLRRIGVTPDQVAAVSYRGNGCPGPTRVVLKSGRVIERSYLEFWGEDSSMWQLPWRCKICPDGTAEAADIAAADTWPGGSPSPETLDNDPGTNVLLVRTKAGARLVEDAASAGYLVLDGAATTRDLDLWQPHQLRAKIASGARLEGMRKAGHQAISTPGLRTQALRRRLDEQADRRQMEGTEARIAIGKHRDEYRPDA